MAQRLTDRTELTATPAAADFLHVVDVSDLTDGPAGTSKKVQFSNLGGGDVSGPSATTTATALVLWKDAAGQDVLNSVVLVDPAGNMAGLRSVNATVVDTANIVAGTFTQNDTTNNPNALNIINIGTGKALDINMDGNGLSLNIDSEATTADIINIDAPVTTTGFVFDCTAANTFTTGGFLNLISDSANTGTRNLVNIVNDNVLAIGATCLNIQQDDPAGVALNITGGHFVLPSVNGAATPTLTIGNVGIYEQSSGVMVLALSGSIGWEISAAVFGTGNATLPAIRRVNATSTLPAFTPRQGDSDTGVGWFGEDALSFPVGGVEGLRLTEVSSHVIQKNEIHVSITASTTQTQGQQPLLSSYNKISVVANVNDVVTMTSAGGGIAQTIVNKGVNTLQIFPAPGDDLGAGVDNSVTLAAGGNVTYLALDATNWESI